MSHLRTDMVRLGCVEGRDTIPKEAFRSEIRTHPTKISCVSAPREWAMDDVACIYVPSSADLKRMSPRLSRRADSPTDRSRVAADCQGPEIGNEVCELCGRSSMQSYLLQYPPWQDRWLRTSLDNWREAQGEVLEVAY